MSNIIDVNEIAINVAKQIRKDMFGEIIEEKIEEITSLETEKDNAESEIISEAYAPQKKTYAMTTDFLSEDTKKNHEELYKKQIDSLTKISAEVDAADKTDVQSEHSKYRSIKKDEITNLNAVYLHELYFANCFDPNSELFLDALAYIRLSADWGTFDAWMADFMACALSARSGWVICGYSLYLKRLVNVFVDGHDQGVLFGVVPLIVVDMWEHAYITDYNNDKKSYLTSMMREFDWEVIEERMNHIDSLKKVMG